ncbi:MAG: prephenate/arogenate dehydrogenase [Oscillatoria sp. PMC 1068.18]|nr:prephenate/arogenate dehydrogenase [Oscillatoria sp. PMC 1076.18]MEC4988640.1 prephenate/arogenate dehydrogenase [Oscillatoria sp. PMC 1068.18]
MKVGIVGLGLIGGSLGLDLRSHSWEVIGVSRSKHTCEVAVERGAVDRASVSLQDLGTANLDVIFLCTPIPAIAPTLATLKNYLTPETTVTDVGSVKGTVTQTCTSLWQNFVGGHPMAGTAAQGIEAAQKNLFVNAPYVITPTASTAVTAIKKIEEIALALGCNVYFCTPEAHDRAVSWISHLPVMVSAALIAASLGESDPTVLELAKNLASSGFRDTSRVGGGNPELGLMMAKYNREEVLRSLQHYHKNLAEIIQLIEQENWAKLAQILESTQQARPDFLS